MDLYPGDGAGNLLPNTLTNWWYADYPPSFMTGDFNGDGRLDLLIASDNLSLMLNMGGTNFTPMYINTGSYELLYDAAVGDFTGDGRPDILASTESSVWALVNTGNGTFVRRSYGKPNDAFAVVMADFNSDGVLDGAMSAFDLNVAMLLNLNPAPRLDPIRLSARKALGRLLSPVAQKQVIEVSSNLATWAAIATNSAGVTSFSFTNAATSPQQYYRARVVP